MELTAAGAGAGADVRRLRQDCCELGQEHLFQFVGRGASEEEIALQLRNIDLRQAIRAFELASQLTPDSVMHGLEPVEDVVSAAHIPTHKRREWTELGMTAIRDGSVATLIMSGGQGTRLGYDGPKGMYQIGVISKKSIFQLHVERVAKIRSLSARVDGTLPQLPIYIMTSDLNDSQIREYFAVNNFFGYPPEDVMFFQQGLLPCFDAFGKIILESRSRISMAPDGNGGLYMALEQTGTLQDMKSRGIRHLHVYGVDNILVRSADPLFLGYCIESNAQVGNKVVWRRDALEKVGVLARREGRLHVVEYSELPSTYSSLQDAQGKLMYGAANIANHYLSLDWVDHVVLKNLSQLYHLASKKIPHVLPDGSTTMPAENNGYKLEMFVFDVFPLADVVSILEVSRESEFAPVKNAPGHLTETAESAQRMYSQLCKRWLSEAGATLSSDADDEAACEISPLVSYFGEGLSKYAGQQVSLPCYIAP